MKITNFKIILFVPIVVFTGLIKNPKLSNSFNNK